MAASYTHVLRAALFLLLLAFISCSPGDGDRYTTWRTYNGDPEGARYSRLNQINRANLQNLQIAWEFHTGDSRKQPPSTIECTPVVVDSTMYFTSPGLKVFALNARTGAVLWKFDPFRGRSPRGVNRGVTYWAAGPDRRILFTAGSFLYALDADSGTPVTTFGDSGRVDLRRGLDRDVGALSVTASSPGMVYRDLYITGSSVGEGPGPAAPGHIRAYDVRTGERRWIFHTIPHPGEPGYKTWPPEAWRTAGGANSWAGITLDRERGLVFVPTGSASYDHYGGDRPGQNLFANCLLALDAETGELVWYFQAVHHDIWDYDLASPPALVTVQRDGRTIDAVAQPTKMGHLFVFDRTDGTPLFPIEEREVPQSDLPGEVTWPTQPFPVKPVPYAVQGFTPDLITDLSPAAHDSVARRFQHFRTGQLFLPPSEQGTLTLPQFNGGTDWGGASFDPETHILYVNTSDVAESITMVPSDPDRNGRLPSAEELAYRVNCAGCHGLNREGDGQSVPGLRDLASRYTPEEVDQVILEGRGQMPSFDVLGDSTVRHLTRFLLGGSGGAAADTISGNGFTYPPYIATGHKPFRDPENYPANKPPWGTLNAIDLNTGTIKWQVPLGEHPELTARGIPPTGTFNMGGSIVTAGGLVFIGATKDARFRAFDAATGDILWEQQLHAGAYATPCTYAVDGRQYVVIAAGGGGKPGTSSGDAYLAFALPAGER